ncbi:MAG: PQQ-binding-like beta-propeller repeat protein, partial [Spirochaetia bacterium]
FGVDVDSGRGTRVAVREGRVAVAPRSADTDRLRERAAKAEASGAEEETVAAMEEAIRRMDENSFILEEEEEVDMDEEDMSGGEEAFEEIEQAMQEIEEKTSRGEKVNTREVRLRLNRAAEESSTQMKEKTEDKRRRISEESREQLRKIEEIRVIPFMQLSPASKAEDTDDSAEPSETAELEQTPALVPVTVRVVPEDAHIFLGEREVGKGRSSAVFFEGEELDFSIRREGYEPVAMELTVDEDRGRAYRVRMAALAEPEQEDESKTEAEEELAAVDEQDSEDTGEVSDTADTADPEAEEGQVSLEETEPEPQTETEETEKDEPATGMLKIEASPGEAEIRIDGKMVGRGQFSEKYTSGETVEVEARHPGFAEKREEVTIGDDEQQVSLRLEPQPIEHTFSAIDSKPIKALVSGNNRIFGADDKGTVYSIDPSSGVVSWKVDTDNSNNENSQPVVGGGYVVFTGDAELVVVDADNGKEETRRPLSGTQSHLFGRNVTAWNDRWLFPSDKTLKVLDKGGEETEKEIEIPGGSKMSAGIVGNMVVIADQQGNVLVIDPESGEVQSTVSTEMIQPVALSAAGSGSIAYLAGRRGKAVAVDTQEGSLVWEKQLSQEAGVYVDPVPVEQVVLFLQNETLTALDKNSGSIVYELSDAAGSAVVLNGSIYYATTTGELRKVDPSNGDVSGSVELPENGAAAPAVFGEQLAVPLVDGGISIIHTAGIR